MASKRFFPEIMTKEAIRTKEVLILMTGKKHLTCKLRTCLFSVAIVGSNVVFERSMSLILDISYSRVVLPALKQK